MTVDTIIAFVIGLLIGAVGLFVIMRKDPTLGASLTSTVDKDIADLKKDVADLKAKVK